MNNDIDNLSTQEMMERLILYAHKLKERVDKSPSYAITPEDCKYKEAMKGYIKGQITRKFKGIDIHSITYLSVNSKNLYVHMPDKANIKAEVVIKMPGIRLTEALLLLEDYGFVRINKNEALDVHKATFREDEMKIIVNNTISFNVTKSYLRHVKLAIEHKKRSFRRRG
jgi:hypothetical protein